MRNLCLRSSARSEAFMPLYSRVSFFKFDFINIDKFPILFSVGTSIF
jgi:hypothetical protein